jgi:hypothetical protein
MEKNIFPLFSEEFDSIKSIEDNFDIKLDDGEEILAACYNIGGYEGDAYVLFRQNGKLFEVFASHCSCYGLEGQWSPEETTLEKIDIFQKKGSYYDSFKNDPAWEKLLDFLREQDLIKAS